VEAEAHPGLFWSNGLFGHHTTTTPATGTGTTGTGTTGTGQPPRGTRKHFRFQARWFTLRCHLHDTRTWHNHNYICHRGRSIRCSHLSHPCYRDYLRRFVRRNRPTPAPTPFGSGGSIFGNTTNPAPSTGGTTATTSLFGGGTTGTGTTLFGAPKPADTKDPAKPGG
jgi:hypothetical protein